MLIYSSLHQIIQLIVRTTVATTTISTMLNMAFTAPFALSTRSPWTPARRDVRPRAVRRTITPARMMADENESTPSSPADETSESMTSASGILKILREDTQDYKPPSETPQNLGVTRDADGKSNVWAVEPPMTTDQRDQIPKATILAAVFGVVLVALLILPKLPFTNGDQF